MWIWHTFDLKKSVVLPEINLKCIGVFKNEIFGRRKICS